MSRYIWVSNGFERGVERHVRGYQTGGGVKEVDDFILYGTDASNDVIVLVEDDVIVD